MILQPGEYLPDSVGTHSQSARQYGHPGTTTALLQQNQTPKCTGCIWGKFLADILFSTFASTILMQFTDMLSLILITVLSSSSYAFVVPSNLAGARTLRLADSICISRRSGHGLRSYKIEQRGLRTAAMQLDPNVVNFAVGAAAGAISSVAVFPIEYAKTKMQNAREPAEKERYSSTLKTMVGVVHERGPFALWSGVFPVILGSAPESAIQLATHSFLVASMLSMFAMMGEADLPMLYQIIAGAMSGFTTIIATNPMEVLRLKASQDDGASMFENIRSLGITGLFKGCGATWLRDIPFSAVYFPTYMYIKQCAAASLPDSTWEAALIAGLVSGFLSSFVTTPADVIKTRIQSGLAPEEEEPFFGQPIASTRQIAFFAPAEDRDATCVRRTAQSMLQEEGWETFFSGAGARVGKLGPGMAITLVVYEGLQQLLAAF